MLVFVFLLFVWCANAYSPQCTNMNETSMTFKPTEDGVLGRYRAELCTRRNPNVTEWTIDLSYYDTSRHCNDSLSSAMRHRAFRPDHQHSTDTVVIEDTNNCTHVCYAMDLDLIFSSCYGIKSIMSIGDKDLPPYDSFHLVTNNLTIESIKSNKPHVNFVNHEGGVTLIWYLGIPPTNYRVFLCQKQNATGAEILDACIGELPDVTDNCTRDELHNELQCVFAPPYYGLYHALVEHDAPWTEGVFSPQQYTYYDFSFVEVSGPLVSPGRGGAAAWWACGGALLLAAAALAAAAARRAMRRCAYHKQVLDDWRRQRLESEPAPPPVVEELGSRPILLLYAREGEHGQLVITQLVELLQQATASPVYDLCSARVCALAGRAPHEWVRAALARRGARVLLLQTPALAALYRDQLHYSGDKLKLAEPLLGRRVARRAPQFADALLHYALRLVALDAHAHHAYHKYYLATLTELSTDILQQVVPYRRYTLPHAATALVRDLAAAPAPAAPDPQLLQQFERAVDQFVTHAGENPNYLMDELLVITNN